MSFTLRFADTVDNWNTALKTIMTEPSYENFFTGTGTHPPMVVPNLIVSGINQHHDNKTSSRHPTIPPEVGTLIFGWTVACDDIFSNFPDATCILTHHRALLLADGSVINPFSDGAYNHCIFLRDDDRTYDDYSRERYNERVYFTDRINGYSRYYGSRVEADVVYFAHGTCIEDDSDFETYREFSDAETFLDVVRFYAPGDKLEKWIAMCTNVTFDYRQNRR